MYKQIRGSLIRPRGASGLGRGAAEALVAKGGRVAILDLPRSPGRAVAEALGFRRLVVNPQCAQNSRGKVELQAIGALAAATLDLRRLAWDLSLFCMSEFSFVVLPERYCTGSSIMPQTWPTSSGVSVMACFSRLSTIICCTR